MTDPIELTEERAFRIAQDVVEAAGGTGQIYRNPRHPFAANAVKRSEEDGISIELRFGEISSPAIITVGRYVFEIHEESIDLLMTLPIRKAKSQN